MQVSMNWNLRTHTVYPDFKINPSLRKPARFTYCAQ